MEETFKIWAKGCPGLGRFQSPSEQRDCDSCLFVLSTWATTSVTAMPVSNAKPLELISNKLLHPSKATGFGQDSLACITFSQKVGQTYLPDIREDGLCEDPEVWKHRKIQMIPLSSCQKKIRC